LAHHHLDRPEKSKNSTLLNRTKNHLAYKEDAGKSNQRLTDGFPKENVQILMNNTSMVFEPGSSIGQKPRVLTIELPWQG
jgi:hypothetical protein